jgi:hypothetical protein
MVQLGTFPVKIVSALMELARFLFFGDELQLCTPSEIILPLYTLNHAIHE